LDPPNGNSLGIYTRINDAGNTAFYATLSGNAVTPQNDRGIWYESAGTLNLAVRSGETPPGFDPGVSFADFGDPALNSANHLAFRATLTGSPIDPSNDTSIWSNRSGPMSLIAREEMGNATSIFNLMRNLGGGIGIAMTGTMLSRQQQTTAAMLSANVTAYDPASQSLLAGLRSAFIAGGTDAVTATTQAYAAMNGLLQRQASMVSFVGIFQMMGIVFIALVPLVLLMKRPRGRAAVGAH
jgi:hypothetical protein